MSKIDDGVRYYTKAKIVYEFGFPQDYTVCVYCPFCYKGSTERFRCGITGEYLPFAQTERGQRCPAEIIQEDRTDEH